MRTFLNPFPIPILPYPTKPNPKYVEELLFVKNNLFLCAPIYLFYLCTCIYDNYANDVIGACK